MDYNYILLTPFLLRLCEYSCESVEDINGKNKAGSENVFPNRKISLLCLIGIVLVLLASSVYHGNGHISALHWIFGDTYKPSSSVFWYLEAQVFPEFRDYFIPLLSLQPSILAVLIYLAFSSEQCKHDNDNTLDHHKLFTYHLMVTVILVFKPAMALCDLAFATTLLCSYYPSVIRNVKHGAWFLAGILVTFILQLLMAHLWIGKGTGNANFLFFQNLVNFSS